MTSTRADHLTRFQPKPDALASQPVSVFLPKDLDAVVRSLPNRSHWLRRVIAEAAQRELMSSQPSHSQSPHSQSSHPQSSPQPNESDCAAETQK